MHLSYLQASGLFVKVIGDSMQTYNIFTRESEVIVECRYYITDCDDETHTINILEVGPYVRNEEQKCVACSAALGEVREYKRGAIECPLSCGAKFTIPYSLIERVCTGVFTLIEGQPAKLDRTLVGSFKPEFLHAISEALSTVPTAKFE